MVGTTKIVSSVPSDMPPTMTQPICRRLSEPAPWASARGIAPSTIAPVVIRMGRKRCGERPDHRRGRLRPCSRNWLVNSTIRIPCLVIQPHQRDQANLRIDVERSARPFAAPAVRQSSTRHRQHDDQGSTKLSNWAASTRKMNSSASANTMPSAPCELRNSREVPLRSVGSQV